ncbi:MAG: NfeD family protein [Planctomycetota bacterium]
MDPWFLAVLLLLLSMVLLFAEVLIPSGGLLFFGSMLALAGAVWSAYSAWWYSNPLLFWGFVIGALILLPASVAAAIQVWPHTPMGKQLEPPTSEEVTPFVVEQQRLGRMIGQIGETVTPLNPAGMVLIAGERVHCFSEGLIVERGVRVRVLAVQGNRVLVRPSLSKDGSMDSGGAIPNTSIESPVVQSEFWNLDDSNSNLDLPPGRA